METALHGPRNRRARAPDRCLGVHRRPLAGRPPPLEPGAGRREHRMNVETGLLEAAEAEQEATVALRRAIHAEPELGLDCPRTAAKLKDALAGLPLAILDSQATSGFIARLDGA